MITNNLSQPNDPAVEKFLSEIASELSQDTIEIPSATEQIDNGIELEGSIDVLATPVSTTETGADNYAEKLNTQPSIQGFNSGGQGIGVNVTCALVDPNPPMPPLPEPEDPPVITMVTPEPATLAIIGLGLAGIGWARIRRRR